MTELLVGLLCFVLGLVLTGSAWAWVELRRDHRRQGAELARVSREHEEERAALVELRATLETQGATLHAVGRDLDTAARMVGFKRYGVP